MSEYIDHLPTWQTLAGQHDFSNMTLLEYGCGAGTKTLCQLFKKCVSIELYDKSFLPPNWFLQLELQMRKDAVNNWEGKLVQVSENISNIEHQIRYQDLIITREYSGSVVDELKKIISNDVQTYQPDVIFIDPGIHARGEMARIIMENKWASLVIVHDYYWGDLRYGYHLIKETPHYAMSIPNPGGVGTAVYALKNNNEGVFGRSQYREIFKLK
jgi:hypothetical protein